MSAGLPCAIVIVTPSDPCAGSHPVGLSSQARPLRLVRLPDTARLNALRYVFFSPKRICRERISCAILLSPSVRDVR